MLRGLHASLGTLPCRTSSLAGTALQAAYADTVAGLPLLLQPFTSLRTFASAATSTQHLRDFAIIGESNASAALKRSNVRVYK